MSRNICLFDLFPNEIIYLIFEYLSSNEILRIFLKLTRKLNKIVLNYKYSQINLKSISKNDFDLICINLKGKEIKSLILSDDFDTPNQSNLFLKLFSIEELNLYSLTLINVNIQPIELIGKNLFSLKLLNTHLIKSSQIENLFRQLKQLNISSEDLFENLVLMDNLEYLTISNKCSFNQFGLLLNNCPKLISLNINVQREAGEHISIMNSKLNRLIMNMSNCQMNLIEMKEILNNFRNLIQLEIECRIDFDLCDGYQWEKYFQENLISLKNFNFKFQLNSTILLNQNEIEKILNSYSTYFWLNEKHWFIAFELNQRLIYSIPRFSCESADQNFRPPIYSTTINKSIFYDHINALALWEQSNNYFKNVKELWIVDDSSKINFDLIVNLNKIERLIFVSSNNENLINLIMKMKSLYFIQFSLFSLLLNDFNDNFIFKQINSIKIIKEIKSFESIQLLNQLFPQIKSLNIPIKSIEQIKFIFKLFSQYLSIIKFDCDPSLFPSLTQKSFEKMLGHSNLTCAFDRDSIRLWIGSKQDSNEIDFEEKKSIRCFSWCSKK